MASHCTVTVSAVHKPALLAACANGLMRPKGLLLSFTTNWRKQVIQNSRNCFDKKPDN
jgi:hypothetical protein